MRRRIFVLLAVSVCTFVGGCITGLLAMEPSASKREAELKRGYELRTVLIAARKLPAGTLVTQDDLRVLDAPRMFATESVLFATDASSVLGKKLFFPLQQGEPVLWSHFTIQDPGLVCEEMAKFKEAIRQ